MKIIAAVMIVVFCQVPAMSREVQTSSGPGNPALAVSAFLGFSETQTSTFLQMFTTLQNALHNLQEQMQTKQHQLQELLSMPQPDPASLGRLMLEIHALEMQGQKMLDSYHAAFRELLTPEQLQKVQAVSNARDLIPAVAPFAAVFLVAPPSSR
jgi:Spy/CpxP family protein refolding chaperone